jgi:hypothetical protein
MSVFTFEIVRHGEAPVIADVLGCPMNEQFGAVQKLGCPMNERFGAVQKLWLFASKTDSAFIRVKNSEAATIVGTGVTTALASIEKCSCVACPLKRELVSVRKEVESDESDVIQGLAA